MYVVPLVLFAVAEGRFYYVAPAYPMLYAEGAVWCEKWVGSMGCYWNGRFRAAAATALLADILVAAAIGLPIAPLGTT